jgi:DNA-binding NarL/FixJ family response regulator
MNNLCKVVLVDDHNLFRDGLKYVLGQTDYIKVVAEAADGIEFLNILENDVPDIVLMDISMPRMNGIEATTKAISQFPDLKIIALTMFGDENYCYSMLQAGAKGFVLKESGCEELIKAITKVLDGDNYFSNSILTSLIKSQAVLNKSKTADEGPLKFSKREMEVLKLICDGYSNKEIAEKLSISQRTIEGNRFSLLNKTGSKDSVNLALFALKNNLLE